MALAVAKIKSTGIKKTKARVARAARKIVVSKKAKIKTAKSAVGDVVRARIDHDTKLRATETLDAMGLNISDAIRLMLRRVADEQRLPFEIKVPNRETAAAISELEGGKGKRVSSVDALMADLYADD